VLFLKCLEELERKRRETSERSWVVPVEDIVARNYDLSATNPNACIALAHPSLWSSSAQVASIGIRLMEAIEELQESLEIAEQANGASKIASTWCRQPVGNFISRRKELITISDDKLYKRVTVKLHAKGIVPRDAVYGREIKTKTQYPIEADELLVAEIDAKVGGYGIVPKSLAGAIVSSHYYLYQVDTTRLNLRYLEFWLRKQNVLEQVRGFIKGALNYAAIRPQHFPQVKIPVPPNIEEQERIAQLLTKAHSLKSLNGQLALEIDALLPGVSTDKAGALSYGRKRGFSTLTSISTKETRFTAARVLRTTAPAPRHSESTA